MCQLALNMNFEFVNSLHLIPFPFLVLHSLVVFSLERVQI